MGANYSAAVSTAKDYYDSGDADNFYYTIWGGEDIHVGLYESGDEPIFAASRRTVTRMAERLRALGRGSRVLDIGAGYGGAARYLAGTYGCRVDALNLSEVENRRGREMNRRQGLDHLVTVVDGSFEDVPAPAESYDVVWSQDAILHSGNRTTVLREVRLGRKPGGAWVFTDPRSRTTARPGYCSRFWSASPSSFRTGIRITSAWICGASSICMPSRWRRNFTYCSAQWRRCC